MKIPWRYVTEVCVGGSEKDGYSMYVTYNGKAYFIEEYTTLTTALINTAMYVDQKNKRRKTKLVIKVEDEIFHQTGEVKRAAEVIERFKLDYLESVVGAS